MSNSLLSTTLITPFIFILTACGCGVFNTADKVTITSCYDGDTCRAGEERIRLNCIDAAEMGAGGAKARKSRDYLRSLVLGKTVKIYRTKTDIYGRTIAELYVDDVNIQQKMVETGHAEIYEYYASECAWTN